MAGVAVFVKSKNIPEPSKAERDRQIARLMRAQPYLSRKAARDKLSRNRREGKRLVIKRNPTPQQVKAAEANAKRAETIQRRKIAKQRNAPFGANYKRDIADRKLNYSQQDYDDAEIRALRNMDATLGHFYKYDRRMVRGRLEKTSMPWLRYIADAAEPDLLDLAAADVKVSFSPFWYH